MAAMRSTSFKPARIMAGPKSATAERTRARPYPPFHGERESNSPGRIGFPEFLRQDFPSIPATATSQHGRAVSSWEQCALDKLRAPATSFEFSLMRMGTNDDGN